MLRCPPPSGWCCFPPLLLGGGDFLSYIKCFFNYVYFKLRPKTARKDIKGRGGREGGGAALPERRRVRQHHPVRMRAPPNRKRMGKQHNLFKKNGTCIPNVTVGRRRPLLVIVANVPIVPIVDRPPSSPPSPSDGNHRPTAPHQRSEENSTTHTVREEEQHHSK